MAHRRIPSLNWLRVFEAAARSQSFARAAEQLNMSPAAVSQQIKALEGYLGRALFERGARHVTLSDAGRAFLPSVRQSLHAMETAATSLFGSSGQAHLTVQCSLLLACGWLAPRLGDFHASNPGISVMLTTANQPEEFGQGGADIRIVFGSQRDFPETSVALLGETLFPIATPGIAATIRQPSDLLAHQLVEVSTHRSGWFQVLEAAPKTDISAAQIIFADTSTVALAMAASGACVALARAPATDNLAAAYGLVPCACFEPIAGFQSYFVVHSGLAGPTPAAKTFTDWLLSQAARPNS